jgi:hypothetical protein
MGDGAAFNSKFVAILRGYAVEIAMMGWVNQAQGGRASHCGSVD